MIPYDRVLKEKIELTELEEDIIDLEEFQRLKSIKQNGFSYVSYPDAKNTRFDHSVGTLYWATKLYESILPKSRKISVNDDDLESLRLAALIHDIGHGPFSHALEMVLDRNSELLDIEPWRRLRKKFSDRKPHEMLTLEFAESKSFKELTPKNIHRKVIDILKKRSPLSLLISGDLDADRLDYLIRDSTYSGLPFGFNVKAIFSEIIQHNLGIERKDSEWFLLIDSKGVPAFEQLLMARYAHYFYIAYEPTVLLANLVFVSELEKTLWQRIKKIDKIALAIFYIFTKLTDDRLLDLDFADTSRRQRELLDTISNRSTLEIFENLKKSKIDRNSELIRLSYLGKRTTYNFFKARTSHIKELEGIVSKELGQPSEIHLCLPEALTTRTCIFDKDIKQKYVPSLVYDYSPIVRALEQKMYLDCGIMISSIKPISRQKLIKIFGKVGRRKTDFDIYTYAILNYIKRIQQFFSKDEQKWKLRRSSLFKFLRKFMETFAGKGLIESKIYFKMPWYSEEFYEILQKLEFLDVLSEDFNLGGGNGFIPCYVYSTGEYAEELLGLLVLTREEKYEIEMYTEEYIRRASKYD